MTEVSKFDDARMQVVYDILCTYVRPPSGEDLKRFVARRIVDALAAPTTKAESAHPDDIAVDALATAMKFKLAKQRSKGYGGWDTDCTQQRLSDLLRGHVDKGDPIDVANFCAFLSARGEGIAAAPADALDAAFEAVRKKLCKLPKFSFVIDREYGHVTRKQDDCGRWIEFDEVHKLFDPVAVDAAIAAQAI